MSVIRQRLTALLPELRGSVFVVGYARSGSTLVQAVLNTMSGAHVAGENFAAIEGIWRAVASVRRLKAEQGQTLRPAHDPWHGAQNADPEAFAADLLAAFVTHVLRPPPGTRWLGFKEIRYTSQGAELAALLDFLLDSFPGARIVMTERPRAEVLDSGLWQAWDRAQVDALLAETEAQFQSFRLARPGRVLRIRHEDWARLGVEAARPLLEFLDEPFRPEVLSPLLQNRLPH